MSQKLRIESGQWCEVHDIHQDDPDHEYDYWICEGHHRWATMWENLRCWFRLRA